MVVGMLVSSCIVVCCWRALFAGNESKVEHGGKIANKICQYLENKFIE
jgi:hypothetical protein